MKFMDKKASAWWINGVFSLLLLEQLALLVRLIWTHNEDGIVVLLGIMIFLFCFWTASIVEACE
jgi:hypothetical protein